MLPNLCTRFFARRHALCPCWIFFRTLGVMIGWEFSDGWGEVLVGEFDRPWQPRFAVLSAF